MNGFIFWNDVLNRVRDVYWGASTFIAGGCVRDYFIGLEPKDIDVFIQANPTGQLPAGFEWDLERPERPEYEAGLNGIRGIEDFVYQGTKINVIYIGQNPYDYTTTHFDSRINQGYVNINFLEVPAATMRDLESKTYTIHRMGPNSMNRAERFLEKVSRVEQGWRLVVEDNAHNQAFRDQAQAPDLNWWGI